MNDQDTPQNAPIDHNSSQNEQQDPQIEHDVQAAPAKCKSYAKWIVLGVAIILAGALGTVFYKTPAIASNIARSRMESAGLANPKVKVDTVGPFYAEASNISFSGKVASVTGAKGQAGYSPADVVFGGPVDTATVEDLHAVVDLDKILASPAAGKLSILKLPFLLPKALADIPARSLLVRGAKVDIKAGKDVRTMTVDTLSRQSASGPRSAAFSIQGDNGDQFIVSVEGQGASNSISADGSFDILGWFLSCGPSMGMTLPEKVGVESAPLVLQFILNESGQTPGKWVGIVSQPWFQYEKGPLTFLMQDARAGFTGEKETLKKAAAEADVKFCAGPITVGPFHPVASANSSGETVIHAEAVPITAPGASMKLDYVKVTTNLLVEGSELGLHGTMRPSWLPGELALNISVPSTLDGVFVDLSMPTMKLNGVSVPAGWLPKTLEGLKVYGSVTGEMNISAGGMTAGGCASTGRISADNASISLSVGGKTLVAQGVHVDDARVATLVGGFSVQLPKGIKADSVKYGSYDVKDLQVWPCRISFPGDANIGSATASFFGGRIISSALRGAMTSDGTFVPTSQFEISATGIDLSQVSAILPGNPGISGSVDLIVRVNPPASGEGFNNMRMNGNIKSPSISFHGGDDTIVAENLDATFEYDGSKSDNPSARIQLLRPVDVTAFNVRGFVITGTVNMDGWMETSLADISKAAVQGMLFAARSSIRLGLKDAGISFGNRDVSVEGVTGTLLAEQDGNNSRIASDGEIEIDSIKYRSIALNEVASSFQCDNSGLSLAKFDAAFCDGTLSVSKFAKVGNGYKFTVTLENISAASLAALFPNFKGRIEGRFDGELNLGWEKGVFTIYPGSISMKSSSTCRFSYPDTSLILNYMKGLNDLIKTRASQTVENMIITTFTVSIDAAQKSPIEIHIVGDGVDNKNSARVDSVVPFDAMINLQGDVAEAIGAYLGGNVKVRFAPAK
jgi:hypothetical protein